jgi:hypothetical protein
MLGKTVRSGRLEAGRLITPENPATSRAMGIHAAAAVVTFTARRDAGNKDVVAGFERGNRCPYLLDHADAFMSLKG